MAQVEPMDIDNVGSDFDDKENSLQNSNFFPRTPCTEKGYEELDVSELNMKLRYSITPASSPMSKSYTASCKDNKTYTFDEDSLNSTIVNNSANLTRSLNSSITKCDIVTKSPKLPLQALTTDNNSSVRRSLDNDPSDITITVNGIDNIDENLSLPSGSSSAIQTPEATTPTKDIPKGDVGSPIMRGLKSVLSMFRSSQSPIPPEDNTDKRDNESHSVDEAQIKPLEVLASTPKVYNKNNDNNLSKRSSPLKDSVVFNDDLERELQWKDETTIIFKQEKMPIHKLFLQQSTSLALDKKLSSITNDMHPLNSTVEYMDISYNESCIGDKTTDVEDKICINNVDVASGVESDGEFLDCETTYTKNEQIDLKQHTSTTNIANLENNVSTQEISNEKDVEIVQATNDVDIVQATNDVEIIQATNATNVEASDFNDKERKCEADLVNEFQEPINNISLDAQKEIECHTQDENHLIKDMNLTSADTKIELNIDMQQQQQDILTENFIKNEENKTSDFENQNNSILSSSINKEYTKQKDENHLNFDATMCLNIVTDCQDNILLHQNNDSNNFILINKENLDSENKTLPLNSGILQICEKLSDQTVHEHGNNTLDLKSDTFNLEDHTEETNIENDLIVNSKEYVHDNVTHDVDNNCEKNAIFDSIGQNTQELETVSKQEEISKYDSIKNQNDDNVNDLENMKSQDIDKDFNLYGLSLNDVNDHLPSDIPLPSDDDIEKDSLMDNFVIEKDDEDGYNNFDCTKNNNTKDNLECMDSINQGAIITDIEITSKDLNNISATCITPLPNSDEIKDISLATENVSNSTYCDLLINKTEIVQASTPVDLPDSETNLSDTVLETNENHQCLNNVDIAINETIGNTVSVTDGCMDNQSIKHTDQGDEEKELENKYCVLNEENNVNILDDDVGLKENKLFDEEIVTSANNSPYVSVNDLDLNIPKCDIKLDDIESPFETKNKIDTSPPISPKLSQKGYNINFDEIEDPFATKTNIRMSPPPDFSPNNSNESVNITQKKVDIKKRPQPQNRRKSQPEREKRDVTKKRFNSSYNCDTRTSNCKKPVVAPLNQDDNKNVLSKKQTNDLNCTTTMLDVDNIKSLATDASTVDNINISNTIHPDEPLDIEENKSLNIEPTRLSFPSKNVFNIPEIDDKNFNPFATKSKICMSPSPTFEEENTLMEDNITPSDSVTEMSQQTENLTSDLEQHVQDDKVVSSDVSSETCSSRNTDKDFTVREIHTEDEDTVEGPFLEVEEFADVVKVSDFGNEADMMQFEDLHADINNENKEDGELFIDAEAFEFLLNQNKCNVVTDSGKESLFLKFDPLFAKRVSSDGVLAALNRIQKRQSTPKKTLEASKQNNVIDEEKPSVSASNVGTMFEENNDETVMVAKPMMVVNPAINSLVSPRKSVTPPRINRRSLTFTSPAMAVIDRLLSLSGNSSNLDHDATPPRGNREYNETDVALTQLRELLAEKEIHVHNLRSESKELKERLSTMESQVKTLEKETEERLKKVNDLNERLAEKTKVNKSMAVVVEEYERTIASLIAEMDIEKRRNAEERTRLISERDEQTAHLASMEVSFSDLHSKYEKSKQIILSMKANEDTYRKSIKDFEENLLKMQNNYELLKQHATSKLNHANQELEKFNRAHESEVLKLNAMIKRKELHITSLEESLTQKTKANEELTAICDELINKVG